MALLSIRGAAICLVVCISASLAGAQWQLDHEDAQKIDRALAQGIQGDELKCGVEPIRPFLDFAFRFNAGYVASCPVQEFDGKESTLISYLRITPASGGNAVVLAQGYTLPGIPASLAPQVKIRKVRAAFETSGVFALGEGQFTVDFILTDNRKRVLQKQWTFNAKRNGREKQMELSMPPNQASAVPDFAWSINTNRHPVQGTPVTVFLDVAPINPYATKLRAWDRSFLLGSLSSLLRQVPAAQVRLIAFNLEQQRVLFRQDNFDSAGFQKLSRALEQLELGTVSYKALQKDGWATLLASLVNDEISRPDSSGTVVFLGPCLRNFEKVPPSMLLPRKGPSPQFFYLEYFPAWRVGREFPDTIHYTTTAYKGTVLKVHSPAELADAVRKVNQRMQAFSTQEVASPRHLATVQAASEVIP